VILLPEKNPRPKTEAELLERCSLIEGMTFAQLGAAIGAVIPDHSQQRKGWIGQLLEPVLGTDAGNLAEPDFRALGVELKTLPIGASGAPAESTYITSIPLLTIHQQTWHSSECYAKLKRVLWVPLEGDTKIPYGQRRIGRAFLWSPDTNQEAILAADWNYLSSQISTGYLDTVDASVGEYLQIRPKAANGRSLCYCFDSEGTRVKTLPRGFYLRPRFTDSIMRSRLI
jgi:DNA mismatch repair protein MutH